MSDMDPAREAEPASIDASRRTHLASERTLLAWWRSGLAAMAVALAVGRLLPALLGTSTAPFSALGVGFAVLALAFIVYGTRRQRDVDRAIERGNYRALDGWVVLSLTAVMAILAVATIVLILAEV